MGAMSSSTICIDASAAMRLLVPGRHTSDTISLWKGWVDRDCRLVAPTLLFYEITNALYRYAMAGHLRSAGIEPAIHTLERMEIELVGDMQLHHQALEIALRLGMPAVYNAHYLALAWRLEAELWTADRRLYEGAKETYPFVRLMT